MADTMSVRAILSAADKGFSSTMKAAYSVTDKLSTKLDNFSSGIFMGMGQQAFSSITQGVRGLVGEVDTANAAWKTFEGNMKILGKSSKEINAVKKDMQAYAEATIYSSSDMASTYAQLAAVGTKNADKLVKGFGGLAAAAENPQQAMKTLSTQATQMAARPNVAWADFKLMLEQTPAGIAAVAKEMGMTTAEMVAAIQEEEIATNDFFDAIQKVGTSDGFEKLAMDYKTVGQAMGGLQETLANKLGPAWDFVSGKAISAVSKIIDKISKIDANTIVDKLKSGMKQAKPYWDEFVKVAQAVWKVLKKVGKVIGRVFKYLGDNSEELSKFVPVLLGVAGGFKAFSIVKSVVGPVAKFSGAILNLAKGGIGKIAAKLFPIAKGEKAVGKASQQSAGQTVAAAKAFMMMGVAVVLVAAGFAILAVASIALAKAGPLAIGVMFGLIAAMAALGFGMTVMIKTLAPMSGQIIKVATSFAILGAAVILIAAGIALLAFAAISLANAGTPAIACMVGMVAAIALLAVGAAALGPALTAGSIGFLAFGAAILLVGAGALLAAVGMTLLAKTLPLIVMYGQQGAVNIALMGAALMAFAVGALLAGTACIVLGAGLIVAGAGAAVLGAAVLLLGAGLVVAGLGLTLIATMLPLVASGLMMCASAFGMMLSPALLLGTALLVMVVPLALIGPAALVAGAGMVVFGAALVVAAAGGVAMAAALKAVNSSMKSIKKNAKATEKSLKAMEKAVSLVKSGLDAIGDKAKSAMKKLTSAFSDAERKAKSSGAKVGTGFSSGMMNGLKQAQIVAAATITAIQMKFNLGYAMSYSAGANIGKGLANGMFSQISRVQMVATQLANSATKAIRLAAQIHSPSRVADDLGEDYGKGYANGLAGMIDKVRRVATQLVSIPNLAMSNLSMAYAGELSADYDYSANHEYVIEVPLTVDGKQFAKATATYTQEELNRRENRTNRKKGKL